MNADGVGVLMVIGIVDMPPLLFPIICVSLPVEISLSSSQRGEFKVPEYGESESSEKISDNDCRFKGTTTTAAQSTSEFRLGLESESTVLVSDEMSSDRREDDTISEVGKSLSSENDEALGVDDDDERRLRVGERARGGDPVLRHR